MLTIDFPDASTKIEDIYQLPKPQGFEREFIFPKAAVDFLSSGVNQDAAIFPSAQDGDPVVKSFKNFHVQAGHIVRPSNRCKGMYLNVTGDCTIDGNLTMNQRGCVAAGKYVGIFPDINSVYFASSNIYDNHGLIDHLTIGPVGGAGGVRTAAGTWAANGGAGVNNACGGGGSGAAGGNINARCNNGSAGTSFSGGSGGGGIVVSGASGVSIACSAAANGGQGGRGHKDSKNYTSSSGVGNPAGTTTGGAYASPSGTGGLLILVVQGDLTINSGGLISSQGTSAHAASNNGGGSGGGSVNVFCYGKVTINGAIGVAGGNRGGAGSKNLFQKVNGVWQRVAV